MFKKLLLIILLLPIVSYALGVLWVILFYEGPVLEKPVNIGAPVATVEYLEPTRNHRNGSIRKITYRYGTITISRDYTSQFNIGHDRLFTDIQTHWPDFEKKHEFDDKPPMQYLRIMLAIQEERVVSTDYKEELSYKNLTNIELDWRYEGLVGYKKVNGWRYETLKLKTPDAMPIVVSCTEDDSYGANPIYRKGACRYNFNIDKDLYASVRFNKPLMSDFIQVHKDLMEFIDTIRESN